MKEWCLGFIFADNRHSVVLLKKSRTMHVGMWNGVGGKIEKDEIPEVAMVREAGEETDLSLEQWTFVGRLIGRNVVDDEPWAVHLYATTIDTDAGFDEITASYADKADADKPYRVPLDELLYFNLAPHVLVLVYAARTRLQALSTKPIVISEDD